MKDLSVVICGYNAEKYLEECLTSTQGYEDLLDVIFVDDGSTDRTAEIAKKFGVRLIENHTNCGLGASRNIGIAVTQTPHIMFLDADDYWSPNTPTKMLEAIQGHEVAVCNTRTFGDFERDYGRLVLEGPRSLDFETSLNTPVVCWNKIYHTKTLKDQGLYFSPKIPDDNPFWFLFTCAKYGCRINYIDDTLCNYRQVKGSCYDQQQHSVNPYYDALYDIFFMYDYLVSHRRTEFVDWLFDCYFFNFMRHYKVTTGKSDEEILKRVQEEVLKRPSLVLNKDKILSQANRNKLDDIIHRTYKIGGNNA